VKALSLWQPWASLIAYEHKRVETRDWGTNYRGPLLIHAAKRWTREERDAADQLWPAVGRSEVEWPLPLGAVVAVARLAKCMRMTHGLIAETPAQEIAMGCWIPGRWAWYLTDVRRIQPAVPLRGRQGLFDVAPVDFDLIGDFAMLVTACDAIAGARQGR
jgi:hypothetical protein